MYNLHETDLNFVHKRVLGAVGGFISGGGVGGAIRGFARGGGGGSVSRPSGGGSVSFPSGGGLRQPNTLQGFNQQCKDRGVLDWSKCGRNLWKKYLANFGGGGGGCPPPLVSVNGACVAPGGPRDIPGGTAVMGQYGPALPPSRVDVMTLDCLPGMVLGKDELCYNTRDISNKERKWPRGTKPLGTPGEMACLRKAASFGRRMETTVKRMEKIGVLKKRARAKARRPLPRSRQIPSVVQIQQE